MAKLYNEFRNKGFIVLAIDIQEKSMGDTIYLFSAFSLTWIIIFIYIISILRRQKSLEIRIEKIKAILDEYAE